MYLCKAIGCNNQTDALHDFCPDCRQIQCSESDDRINISEISIAASSRADIRPHQFKSVEHLTEVDVFAVHHLFDINDPSGALQYASRKLLLSSSGSERRPNHEDIREARDTLTRWLELNTTLH